MYLQKEGGVCVCVTAQITSESAAEEKGCRNENYTMIITQQVPRAFPQGVVEERISHVLKIFIDIYVETTPI